MIEQKTFAPSLEITRDFTQYYQIQPNAYSNDTTLFAYFYKQHSMSC